MTYGVTGPGFYDYPDIEPSVAWTFRTAMKGSHLRCKFYREYTSVRNFAEHRCHKVQHNLQEKLNRYFYDTDEFDEMVLDIGSWVSGRYTWNNTHFFFENEEDTILFKLRY